MKKIEKLIWLGISGLPGSGKTTIAQEIEIEFREKGYICLTGKVSDIVRQETLAQGLALTRLNMYKVGEEARNVEGERIWAKRFITHYINQGPDVIIVDGIRMLSELKEFRDAFGKKFQLLAIEVETEFLIQRIIQRNRIDDEAMRQNPEQILEKEIAMGVMDCMRNADFTLRNNGEESQLAQMTKSLVSKLISLGLQGE
jgi:dephospho-CoA kinase